MEYPKHTCQKCGHDIKLVETIIDDRFAWNEDTKEFDAVGFADEFDHTGTERCERCLEDWTGA